MVIVVYPEVGMALNYTLLVNTFQYFNGFVALADFCYFFISTLLAIATSVKK